MSNDMDIRMIHMIDTFFAWVRRLFGRDKLVPPTCDAPPPSTAPHERAREPSAHLPMASKKPPMRKKKAPPLDTAPSSLSELLDSLDGTFQAVRLPTMKGSWLSKDSVIGLRKLGVHVPNPWAMLWASEGPVCVDTRKAMPGLMSVSLCGATVHRESGRVYPSIMFGIKAAKLPYNVTQRAGVPYQFGMAYPFQGEMLWVYLWLTIDRATGAIQICDELRPRVVKVPCAHPASRRTAGGRSRSYSVSQWQKPQMLIADGESQMRKDADMTAMSLFRALFNWWVARDERWSVVVKKNGERVTFAIDKTMTRSYFADRDKSIKSKAGTTKKIIHFVRAFERKNGSYVKEHVRGLREFEWNGYHCAVTAPHFNGVTTADFSLASVDEDDLTNEGHYALSKVGKLLADMEDDLPGAVAAAHARIEQRRQMH